MAGGIFLSGGFFCRESDCRMRKLVESCRQISDWCCRCLSSCIWHIYVGYYNFYQVFCASLDTTQPGILQVVFLLIQERLEWDKG